MNIEELYSQLAHKAQELEKSEKKQSFGCPPGCGICCLGFDPDITRPELDHIAKYLATHKNLDELVFAPWNEESGTCRFYRDNTPYHCSIYPVRALVCRTFGYTGRRNKNGFSEFTYCKHMPTNGKRTLQGREITDHLGIEPPLAEDAGILVENLSPGSQRVSLSQAIPDAVLFQRYIQNMSNSDPDPDAPVPPEIPPQAA